MTVSQRNLLWKLSRLLLILLAVIAGTALLIYFQYRRDMSEHRERIAGSSRIVETRCGPIEYGDSGSGIPVLVVHGSGGGYDQGLASGAPLGEGFRIIAPSRFGYLGAPYPEDHSVPAQAEVYACLLDALGLEKVTILGISAGGTSTLEFSQRHPERVEAMIMVAAVSNVRPVRDADEAAQEALLNNFSYWIAYKAMPNYVLQFLGLSEAARARLTGEEVARAYEVLRVMNPLSLRQTGLAHDSTEDNLFDGATLALEQITAPTLVVHARDDSFIPFVHAQYTADHVPNARLAAYEEGGHFVMVRDDALATISTFIKEAHR